METLFSVEAMKCFFVVNGRRQLFVSPPPQRLLDVEKEEQEEAPPPPRTLQALCSIPRRLAISAGLGGTPVTPQLIEVNTMIQKQVT